MYNNMMQVKVTIFSNDFNLSKIFNYFNYPRSIIYLISTNSNKSRKPKCNLNSQSFFMSFLVYSFLKMLGKEIDSLDSRIKENIFNFQQ